VYRQYSAVYPAAIDQNSTEASWDVCICFVILIHGVTAYTILKTINMIHAGLATDPAMCFFLEGYSQGAVAVVNTLRQLTGSSYNAVKGIFVVGNLVHKSGLSCNTDSSGGTSTRFVNGISNNPGIPLNWVYKSLDVCAYVSTTLHTPFGNPNVPNSSCRAILSAIHFTLPTLFSIRHTRTILVYSTKAANLQSPDFCLVDQISPNVLVT
jgi:hypothetical protein